MFGADELMITTGCDITCGRNQVNTGIQTKDVHKYLMRRSSVCKVDTWQNITEGLVSPLTQPSFTVTTARTDTYRRGRIGKHLPEIPCTGHLRPGWS